MKEIKITVNEHNQRMDKFLKKFLPKASSGFIYKMLRKKRIKLNHSKANPNDIINEGDKVQFYISEDTLKKFQNEKTIDNIPVTFGIIYEDSNILLINKPKGLLSHSASFKDNDTVVKQLISYLYKKGEYIPSEEKTFIPSICNRLDRNTSGIIIGGKNHITLQVMNEIIKSNKIKKVYRCIVKGTLNKQIELKDYLIKDTKNNKVSISNKSTLNSKEIHTIIRPIKSNEGFTLLEVELITGRTHQIRLHLSATGYPIIGDQKYGERKTNDYFKDTFKLTSQFLHGYKIKFFEVNSPLQYLSNKQFEAQMNEKLTKIQKNLFKI